MIQIENELLGMLEYSILGNSLQNWLIALCIATITLSAPTLPHQTSGIVSPDRAGKTDGEHPFNHN
jgi:hypothetical protein